MPRIEISSALLSDIASGIVSDDFDSSLTRRLVRELGSELSIFQCERCSSYDHDDNSRCVDDESWCESCADSHAHYWESDSEYHSEPEPEPEDTDREGIEGYHDTDREELFSAVDFDDPALLGIEIETYCQSPSSDISEARRASRGQSPAWAAEDDGSLDDAHGVELVFAPVPLSEVSESYDSKTGLFAVIGALRESGAIAWDAGKQYGMHISVNAGQMTSLHCAKFIRMIHDNRAECERIAGRTERDTARSRGDNWAAYRNLGSLPHFGKETGKYHAAARRSKNRIEVRIFRASLNQERILRNCEFVDSIRVYTQDASYAALNFTAFRAWLALPSQSRYAALRKFYAIVPTTPRTVANRQFATSAASE